MYLVGKAWAKHSGHPYALLSGISCLGQGRRIMYFKTLLELTENQAQLVYSRGKVLTPKPKGPWVRLAVGEDSCFLPSLEVST